MIPQNLTMLRRHKVRLFFFLKNFIRGIILFAIAILFYKLIFRYLDLNAYENIFSFCRKSLLVYENIFPINVKVFPIYRKLSSKY